LGSTPGDCRRRRGRLPRYRSHTRCCTAQNFWRVSMVGLTSPNGMEPEKLDDLPSEQQAAPEEVLAQFLVFRVGAVWYAVLAQRVKAVVGTTTTVRIPGTPAFVAGV